MTNSFDYSGYFYTGLSHLLCFRNQQHPPVTNTLNLTDTLPYSIADCPIAGIDLVFVLDSSGSIGSSNFQLIREFVTSIVDALEIGPNQSQVGIIQFSSSATRLFGLTTYNTKASLLQAIRNIIYSGGGTSTASALSLLSGQGFTGVRSDSQGIPRVAIVVTDGNSNDRAATTQAAQALHATQSSVTVYAVGIGDVDRTELNVIASGSQFVSLIGGFNIQQLQELQEQLREETCKCKDCIHCIDLPVS